MKSLAELQAECARLGIAVVSNGRQSKDPWVTALRNHHWQEENPGVPLPAQVQPMLLGDWKDLELQTAKEIEADDSGWIVQPKLDGVRTLLHVEENGVRITGRSFSEVTYRLAEHQDVLPHLAAGLDTLAGTILDGELVCPTANIDTGSLITASALQAAVAVLATSPENAQRIQHTDEAWLRFHVFDILSHVGQDVTNLPLDDRLDLLTRAISSINNPYIALVPSFVINKTLIHERIIEQGGEGTVWKRIGCRYEPGRRVPHWIKRKRSIEVEAAVIGFKPGTPDRGNGHLVGAIEFGVTDGDGTRPVAWVSNLTDAERLAMTQHADDGQVKLNPAYLGRKAIITGQDIAAKSQRIRHAKIRAWLAA